MSPSDPSSTMHAVVLNQFGSSEHFSLQTVAKPSPKEKEVRIRIKAAGFNPVDWKIREGWYGGNPNLILGCDCSGIVDAIGSHCKELALGDEV